MSSTPWGNETERADWWKAEYFRLQKENDSLRAELKEETSRRCQAECNYDHWMKQALGSQPSEKPLTLDELRGMDGEPVWVERLWGAKIKKWIIASPNEYGLTQGVHEKSQFMAWKTYGVLWRAFRRKPKEEV